ncbi:hypothetical protein CW304_26150 [Bacillus sp. UFRGS-B20]|nr:hypothetical protein CW304_26150 [Bacillus sp. UFRGS-B20]
MLRLRTHHSVHSHYCFGILPPLRHFSHYFYSLLRVTGRTFLISDLLTEFLTFHWWPICNPLPVFYFT